MESVGTEVLPSVTCINAREQDELIEIMDRPFHSLKEILTAICFSGKISYSQIKDSVRDYKETLGMKIC